MFNDIRTLMILVPALPLAAAVVTGLLGRGVLKHRSHWPAAACTAASFLLSLRLLMLVQSGAHAGTAAHGFEKTVTLWRWAVVEGASADHLKSFVVDVTLRADPLTAIMLSMVTFIASLVVLYASGYMQGDRGYWRFFSYVALFVFSMTMLVSVSNFALLYVFWEAVGVCSYLLIGFWFEKPEAAAAGKKAFLVNRVGDFGFALGLFLIWTTYGTLDYGGVFSQPIVGGAVGTAIALLLFVGACGKSAQFPLHVWLPDAMEGPTPVSALIHAATMVTAGVYMVTRCTPLFAAAETAQVVVSCVGGFTALLAALIALTQTDLKRVMAYSTVSQLGYMFLGLGTGSLAGISGGMFHLFTHAFFKALLFLGAGSVMHAMHHVIDMRRFSGLRHILPWTHRTFWFGCLALAGVFPFAGFFSKDVILAAVHDRAHAAHGHGAFDGVYGVLYYGGLFTAFLTAFYTFRALFLTFYGPLRTPPEAHHPHESPREMTIPLAILAACALVVGFLCEQTHWFTNLLWHTPSLTYGAGGEEVRQLAHRGLPFHLDVAAWSTVVALSGIGLASFMYLGDKTEVEQVAEFAQRKRGLWFYQLSLRKFFFDETYGLFIVLPLRIAASVSYFVDRFIIDGLVNLCGWIPAVFGALLRSLQTGMVQFYALAMLLGMMVLYVSLLFGSARLTALFGN